jgi:LysM repeat protein
VTLKKEKKMEPKRFLALVAMILLIIGLSACERPASRAPTAVTTPTPAEGEFPLPGVTEDVMSQLERFATQTAMALQSGTTPGAPGQTPSAPDQTPVSTPQETAVPPTPLPTSPAIVVPTATPGLPDTWTLQKGEHPYCIARRFNVNPIEMLDLSNLSRSGNYPPGTVLRIPKSGNPFPAERSLKNHPTTYTVKSGDTIYSIACEFGDVDPYAIAAANGLSAPYKLTPGQELHIP